MLMKFHNKMMLALRNMVKKSNDLGGIPSCIEMTDSEMHDLLKEINSLRDRQNEYGIKDFTFKFENQEGRMLIVAKEITHPEMLKYIAGFRGGEFQVTFCAIPIVYVPKEYNEQT